MQFRKSFYLVILTSRPSEASVLLLLWLLIFFFLESVVKTMLSWLPELAAAEMPESLKEGAAITSSSSSKFWRQISISFFSFCTFPFGFSSRLKLFLLGEEENEDAISFQVTLTQAHTHIFTFFSLPTIFFLYQFSTQEMVTWLLKKMGCNQSTENVIDPQWLWVISSNQSNTILRFKNLAFKFLLFWNSYFTSVKIVSNTRTDKYYYTDLGL